MRVQDQQDDICRSVGVKCLTHGVPDHVRKGSILAQFAHRCTCGRGERVRRLEYQAPPPTTANMFTTIKPFVHAPLPPYLVGNFLSGSAPTNLKFIGVNKVHATRDEETQPLLVFAAKVYPDYNLTPVKAQDEVWTKRDTTAKVYDGLYVRHWDEYASDKRSRLFSVELIQREDDVRLVLGGEFHRPLEGTKHVGVEITSRMNQLTTVVIA